MKKKTIFVLLFILGLIGYSYYTNGSFLRGQEKAEVGSYAPTFTLTDINGNERRLNDLNKPVLINFWASWCGPCQQETPDLVRLYKKYSGQFEIAAVNVTINDKEENARAFTRSYNMNFPVLFDRKGEVAETYRIMGLPTNVFVDKEGKIIYIANGLLSPEVLEKKIQELIES